MIIKQKHHHQQKQNEIKKNKANKNKNVIREWNEFISKLI